MEQQGTEQLRRGLARRRPATEIHGVTLLGDVKQRYSNEMKCKGMEQSSVGTTGWSYVESSTAI